MSQEVYRYHFSTQVPVEDISSTLLLALWGTESLHGKTLTGLAAGHVFDAPRRTCVIDASTAVGNRAVRETGRRELFAIRTPGDAGDEADMSFKHCPRLVPPQPIDVPCRPWPAEAKRSPSGLQATKATAR